MTEGMQLALARMLIDSTTTLFHLVDDTDGKLFDAFVCDSLIAEREMLKTIRQMRASRGEELSIEKRMESSIKRSAEVANVDLDQLPARRDIGWPSAEERATHLGPTGYVGYRGGSSPIHGTWNDLRRNYITEVEGGFEGQFDPVSPRPQPLFTCALLVAESAHRYLEKVKTSQDVSKLRDALKDLQARISRSDDLHESFLNQ